MVQTKLVTAALCLLALGGCAQSYTWQKYAMDTHRTGVTAVHGDNVEAALGKMENGVYTAPNGTVYADGCTPKVAAALLEVQPRMTPLREVVAHSDSLMEAHSPESPLSNWITDVLRARVSEITGRKADIALMNMGGIRIDMPKGEVTLDDMNSMFPFNNNLVLVVIKGKDLKVMFDYFSSRRRPEGLSGVEYVIDNGVTSKLLIGGVPFDEEAVYTVATIDFLLDGGDGLYLGKNAIDIVCLNTRIGDLMLDYVRGLEARGETIHAACDGRVKIIGGKRK